MKIGEKITVCIKDYVEAMLYEEDCKYYIDEMALAIDPTVVHAYMYTIVPAAVIPHLAKNGLVFSNNVDNCQTMTYRNMVYVTLITCEKRYDQMRDKNYKIESISLDNVVRWAKDRGCDKKEIINLLRRATFCTC